MNLGETGPQITPKYGIATTILRKWNQQWRIQSNHVVRAVNDIYPAIPKVSTQSKIKISPASTILYGPSELRIDNVQELFYDVFTLCSRLLSTYVVSFLLGLSCNRW